MLIKKERKSIYLLIFLLTSPPHSLSVIGRVAWHICRAST